MGAHWLQPRNLRRRLGLRTWSSPPVELDEKAAARLEDLDAWVTASPGDRWAAFDQTDAGEQAWVRRHVAQDLRGSGAIVELGCWLGAMTLAIGDGLRARTDGTVEFHAYDRFRFDDQAHIFAGSEEAEGYTEGDSFRPIFDQRTTSISELVQVHEGDVTAVRWDPHRPIELLFNDVAKSWDTWIAVRRIFYGALAVGACVVEQDFAHPCTPWLQLSHHRWREHFDVVGMIPGTSSLVLQLRRPLPPEELARDDLRDGFSPLEIEEAFDWAESIVGAARHAHVRAARVMLYVLHGDPSVAADELYKAVHDGDLDLEVEVDRELVLDLLPALARRAHEARCSTEAQWGSLLNEERLLLSRQRAARKRGDPWCAY